MSGKLSQQQKADQAKINLRTAGWVKAREIDREGEAESAGPDGSLNAVTPHVLNNEQPSIHPYSQQSQSPTQPTE